MNKNIKKLLACTVVMLSILTVSAFAYSNTPSVASEETVNVIKLLEIANGDTTGNMNYDKEVTRSEFVKMVINASTSKETAANIKLNISLFPDVKNNYWGAGYISVAINNGLVNGYIDGTFKPTNNVTLEEAATIVLRLLGYTNADLVGSYPTAQLQKYKDLELDENIYAKRGDTLTREECMILLYNALSTKTKQGTVYCTMLGLSVNSENKLDYSALLEDKLDGPVIAYNTSAIFEGTKFVENDNTKYILNQVKSTRDAIKENDVVYYSNVINTVFTFRKTATGIVNSSNSATVTISGKTYELATAKAKDKLSLGGEFNEEKSFVTLILGINDTVVDIIGGDVSRINENDNNTSHLSMIDDTISSGIYIKDSEEALNWESKIPFSTDGAAIYFNGSKTSSPSVLAHDVLYYSKPFNTVWIYRKNVSGLIEQITPASSPTSVTVSSKTYTIASSDAAYDLSVFGSFEIGDSVTLVLGLDDECVAVTSPEVTSGIVYGVVTATGEKNYTDKNGDDYVADYVTVVDTAGNSFTYEYSNNNVSVGDAVKVAIAGGVKISRLSNNLGRGNVTTIINAIKNGNFSEDCEIIDVRGSDVIKVKPSRLAGTEIDYGEFLYSTVVLYYEFDSDKSLSKLILSDFTGDIDDYGVITSTADTKVKFMSENLEKSLISEAAGLVVGPARLIKSSGAITDVESILGYIDDIQSITTTAVYDENNVEYPLSDKVKVFIKNASSYDYSSINEVAAGDYTYKAYYDKMPKFGGRIRVIIATRKV